MRTIFPTASQREGYKTQNLTTMETFHIVVAYGGPQASQHDFQMTQEAT